jgi:hypothetical protein
MKGGRVKESEEKIEEEGRRERTDGVGEGRGCGGGGGQTKYNKRQETIALREEVYCTS